MSKSFLLGLFVVVSCHLVAQKVGYRCELDSVHANRFYNIQLTPEVRSKLNLECSNVRIFDSKNIEVPYLLRKEQGTNDKELFVEYPIVEQSHNTKLNYSRLVIRNPHKTAINNIVLRIKSADVQKMLKLNGSNDNKNWYVLKDNYYYNSIYNNSSTSEIRVLNFPMSDYEFYELLIEDYDDKPINITNAGYYNRVLEDGKYTRIDGIKYTVSDTLKESLITIFSNGNSIDKLSFEIEAPNYYLREAELFCRKQEIVKKRIHFNKSTISTFELISNSSNAFVLNDLRVDTLYLRIRNNDNQPLRIKSISLFQLNVSLTADLKRNECYHLILSDNEGDKSEYDLKYFTNLIPDSLISIYPKAPAPLSGNQDLSSSGGFDLKGYWLWIAIVLVAALLTYISFKMINETSK